MNFDNINIDQIVDSLVENFSVDEIDNYLSSTDYSQYQNKPVEFCKEILGMNLTNDVKKMLESVRDYRTTIALSGNGPGKTHGAAATTIWFKKVFSGSQVITAAAPPFGNLKKKLWGEIKSIIRKNQSLFANYNIHSINITEKNDELSFIDGVAIPSTGSEEERESKFSGQHREYLLFVLDEGDAIPDDVFRAIESCMSGGFCRLLIMFNPKRKMGAAYKMIKENRANVVRLDVMNHPNVITGEDVIPGAVTRDQTVKRINEWTIKLTPDEKPDSTCFKVPDFLVGATAYDDKGDLYPPLISEYRKIEVAQFYYMVLGDYPAQGSNQLISQQWIDNARSRYDLYKAKYGDNPPKGIRPILGMDVAGEGGDYNSICPRYGSYISKLRKWRGMDPDLAATKASEIYVELFALQINVESDGLGLSVSPKLRRISYWYCEKCNRTFMNMNLIHCPDCSIENEKVEMKKSGINAKKIMNSSSPTKKSEEFGAFGTIRDQLAWTAREWLKNDSGAMLPPDEKLIEELLLVTFEEINGKIKIMSSKIMKSHLGRSPDSFASFIQAFYEDGRRPRARMIDWGG